MKALLRLAGWGAAATAALVVAVFAAHTSASQQRLTNAMATMTGKAATQVTKTEAPDAAQRARLAATEAETRRLTEMVRSLHTDRERVLTRLAAVERNLEDVTGSIRQQAVAPPDVVTPPAASPPALAAPPATTTPQPDIPPKEAIAPATPAQPPDRVANISASGNAAETDAAAAGRRRCRRCDQF